MNLNKFKYTKICRSCVLDSICTKPCEKLVEFIKYKFDNSTPRLRASIERSHRLGIIKTTSWPHRGKTKM